MLQTNKIYFGDCLEVMKQIDNESIDLIVTDPPYLINYKSNHRKNKDDRFCKPIANDTNIQLIKDAIKECYRVLKNDSAMYMFCSFDKVDIFKQELQKYFNIKNLIVWVKNNWTAGDLEAQYGKQYELIFYVNKGRKKINGKRITDVWSALTNKSLNRVVGGEQVHQNEKPLQLIKMCIENSSNKDDIVLDMFAGSGTTCLAAKELNRKYIGIEIDKYFYKIALDKINYINKNGQLSLFTNIDEI